MKPPLISCIVPLFNGERYLKETLDSILVQTYRPLEIVVADDGSTDGTPAVVSSYGDRIRYFRQENAISPPRQHVPGHWEISPTVWGIFGRAGGLRSGGR
jgi:cellulose synthase/poly-beta-1,6-N-acetylglucosamine synthase-like glycosyltransferase